MSKANLNFFFSKPCLFSWVLRRFRSFVFDLGSDAEQSTFEFSYKVRNSLSDPYYYWFAEGPMFVDEVEIDYQHLKPRIGAVSANCILGNHACEPVHDTRFGIYSVNIDGLVWPGQGAMIIWRSR